ncbi:MAG: hypothetical protein IPN34_06015 [Planctomycetes bacterium]|nr:hypothetical protein [Planctomycetota bacterium]
MLDSIRRAATWSAFCCAILLGACTSGAPLASEQGLDQAWLVRARSQDPAGQEAQEPKPPSKPDEAKEEPKERQGLLVGVLLYLPNRIFDVFDLARVRLRIGPGLSAGLRATRVLNLAIGAHETLFLGLPGPRGEAAIPWPLGIENFSGAEVSLANGTRAGNVFYGLAEIGGGGQLLLLGGEFGIEPWELVDLVVGLITLDPVGDDF